MKLLNQLALAGALTLGAVLAQVLEADAHEIKLGALVIHHPWLRPAPGAGGMAAAYTTIDNTGKEDDTLISITVEGSTTTQIHEMKMEGDVMKMNELPDGLVLPAAKSTELKPKSFHVMLMGIATPFMEGEEVKGTMTFAKAGKVDVDFEVVAPGADKPMKH
ncbi:MAG: copper chaperone PCu(A)C [Alphaproteobacteria bacterium]|nr:copper chaperone PCu(A)C [Alphaproteobacteria bacterium]